MKTNMTTTLHTLVVKELNPSTPFMGNEKMQEWIDNLPGIAKRMFSLMQILVFSRVSDRLVNRHIRQIQRESIFLIDTLHSYELVDDRLKPLHTASLYTIVEILNHIETYYNEFFNMDVTIPDSLFKEVAQELSLKMPLMVTALKNKYAEKALQEMIDDSVTDFLKAGNCSYCRLEYMNGLLDWITKLCNTSGRIDVNGLLKEHLFCYNFNTVAHVRYYKRKMEAELAELFDEQLRYELFCEYEKLFSSYSQQRGSAFSIRNPNIKTTLLGYVRAEKRCLKQKMNGFIVKTRSVKEVGVLHLPVDNCFRVQVSLSVDTLTYFFKLLIKAGMIIGGGPRTHLLAFVARSFQTPGIGAKEISVNSMTTKYNQVVQSTARTVRALLVRMLKILDDEFELGK